MRWFVLGAFLCSFYFSTAQTDSTLVADTLSTPFDTTSTAPPPTPEPKEYPENTVQAHFRNKNYELLKGEIASNILRVFNNTQQEKRVKVRVTVPAGWKVPNSSRRTYVAPPGDSIFIPIRAVPNGRISGNTKFFINAYVNDEETGTTVASDYFFAFTTKHVEWELSTTPGSKIFFKNGENTADFKINLLNTGNFDQELLLTARSSREDLILTDTNFVPLPERGYSMNLHSYEDSIFHFKARSIQGTRNFRNVSLLTHRPENALEERRYSVFVNSFEPKQNTETQYRRGSKIDFIKLANEKTVSPYAGAVLPLQVTGNVQNLLGQASFFSLNARGMKEIDKTTHLVYNTQLNFANNFISIQPFRNLPWYVGYFAEKFQVQAGQINGGVIGLQNSGQGIRGTYHINEQHDVGAYALRGPGLFQGANITSFGLNHKFQFKNGQVRTNYGHSENIIRNQDADIVSTQANYRINQNHALAAMVALSLVTENNLNPDSTIFGYLAGGGYSGQFLDKKLRVSVNGRYNPRTFGSASSDRIASNGRVTYEINKKWTTFLNSNLNRTARFNSTDSGLVELPLNLVSFNQLNFATNTEWGAVQPNLFYHYTDIMESRIHSRGLGLRITKNNFLRNRLTALAMQAGYNRAIDFPELADFFIFQFTGIMRIRTLNWNIRYNYGPNSTGDVERMSQLGINPQMFRISTQYQHTFKDERFVLQASSSYNYNNLINGHNLSVFPEMYFFTYSGWRFGVNFAYSFSSNDFRRTIPVNTFTVANQDLNSGPNVNQGFTVGFSFMKDFGIPIPWSKEKNASLGFTAFFDINGNKVPDKDEPLIENVIVQLGNDEVITDKRGNAKLKNVPHGTYPLRVFALEDLKGWFAEVPSDFEVLDTRPVPIPFVRGVKMTGDVVLEREKLAADKDDPFDLSNIKITAIGADGNVYETLTDFNGHFAFYLPNGTYTLTLDEKIFNTNRFYLAQNDLEFELDKSTDQVYASFYIVERTRKVNIKKF